MTETDGPGASKRRAVLGGVLAVGAQVAGLACSLAGLALLLGAPWALLAGGLLLAGYGVLREAGKV